MPTAAPSLFSREPRTITPERAASQKLYNDRKWKTARLHWLAAHPLCAECERAGQVTAGVVVDHVVPHRGDKALFWDTANWQSLFTHCHAVKSGRGG